MTAVNFVEDMAPTSRTVAAVAVVAVVSLLTQQALGHEYLGVPLARTADCLLNGVIMGGSICQTITRGDDQQCEGDRLFASHLFHVHPACKDRDLGMCSPGSSQPGTRARPALHDSPLLPKDSTAGEESADSAGSSLCDAVLTSPPRCPGLMLLGVGT